MLPEAFTVDAYKMAVYFQRSFLPIAFQNVACLLIPLVYGFLKNQLIFWQVPLHLLYGGGFYLLGFGWLRLGGLLGSSCGCLRCDEL